MTAALGPYSVESKLIEVAVASISITLVFGEMRHEYVSFQHFEFPQFIPMVFEQNSIVSATKRGTILIQTVVFMIQYSDFWDDRSGRSEYGVWHSSLYFNLLL